MRAEMGEVWILEQDEDWLENHRSNSRPAS